jgi:hypothetical protein
MKGELPWQGMRAKNKDDKYKKIMEKKISNVPENLCEFFPGNFHVKTTDFNEYFIYVRNLKFEERPNYSYLRLFFKNLLLKNKLTIDNILDWNKSFEIQSDSDDSITNKESKIKKLEESKKVEENKKIIENENVNEKKRIFISKTAIKKVLCPKKFDEVNLKNTTTNANTQLSIGNTIKKEISGIDK